jgi:hypothetical protein
LFFFQGGIFFFKKNISKRNLPQAEDNSVSFIVKAAYGVLTIKAFRLNSAKQRRRNILG